MGRKRIPAAIGLLAAGAWCGPGVGATLHVPGDYATIQAAIDAATKGDVVLVADGIYTGHGNRDIDFGGRLITVRSANGPDTCTIDCGGSEAEPHRGFWFHSGESSLAIVEGFTIRNGWQELGGGIRCDGSSPTIADCTITENVADVPITDGYGGGLYSNGGSPTVTGCTIAYNTAGPVVGLAGGGGAYFGDGSPTITDCTVAWNYTSGGAAHGGGFYLSGGSPLIMNCEFAENVTFTPNLGGVGGSGGGIYSTAGSPTIVNCTVASNHADGFAWGSGISLAGGSPTLINCTVIDNEGTPSFDLPSGGAGILASGMPTILGCRVVNNKAIAGAQLWEASGGGIRLSNSTALVAGCTIAGNVASGTGGRGGGLWSGTGTVTVVNCAFSANSASGWAPEGGGGGLWSDGGLTVVNSTFSGNSSGISGGAIVASAGQLTNCIVWGNSATQVSAGALTTVAFSDVQGGYPGLGNIDADPLFVDADGPDDAPGTADDDLRLQAGSPCIDAGDSAAVPSDVVNDLDGSPRFVDDPGTADCAQDPGACGPPPVVDMGAFEFQPCPWDLDGDSVVAIEDFLALLAAWGTSPKGPPDLDGDGTVGIVDFLLLLEHWGPC